MQGEVAFAGNRPTPQFLRRFTGYVEQVGAAPAVLAVVCCSPAVPMCVSAWVPLHWLLQRAAWHPAGHPNCTSMFGSLSVRLMPAAIRPAV